MHLSPNSPSCASCVPSRILHSLPFDQPAQPGHTSSTKSTGVNYVAKNVSGAFSNYSAIRRIVMGHHRPIGPAVRKPAKHEERRMAALYGRSEGYEILPSGSDQRFELQRTGGCVA